MSLPGEFSCVVTQICCYADCPAWVIVNAQCRPGHLKVFQDSGIEEDIKILNGTVGFACK